MNAILIIGYGSQGRSQALNLKNSGFDVLVYLEPSSKKKSILKSDKISLVSDLQSTIQKSDTIFFLIPDSKQPGFYKQHLHKNLKPNSALIFAHGYNIHYEQIIPRNDIDVILIAPSAQGRAVREYYKSGFPCFVAIHQNVSGNALNKANSFAKAIGGNPIIKTTFKEETEVDLFGEQTVVCGGLHAIIKTAFDILIEKGYSKEMAYFSCLKEVLPLAKLISDEGLDGMYKNISDTARFGGFTRGERISKHIRPLLEEILKEIQSGKFKSEKSDSTFHEIPNEFSEHLINTLHKSYSKKED